MTSPYNRTRETSQTKDQDGYELEVRALIRAAKDARQYWKNQTAWRLHMKGYIEQALKRKHGAQTQPRCTVKLDGIDLEAVTVNIQHMPRFYTTLDMSRHKDKGRA